MPNEHATLTSLFNDTANAIRYKRGLSNVMVADNFPQEINAIVNTQEGTADANATVADILSPKTAYVNGVKLTGTIATVTHPNPTINKATFNATSGNVEIAANHVQANGYSTGGTTSATTNVTIGIGTVSTSLSTHTNTSPSVTVAHSGNIANIGTNVKPTGTVGTDYYQIGFTNSVTAGNTNARSVGNITKNGYLTNAANTASSWSNKTIGASVTQPATYYINASKETNSSSVSGRTVTTTVTIGEGYTPGSTVTVSNSVANGALASTVTTHTVTNPTVSVSHSGNIATIGSTTKPTGTAGTDYYQIGFTNAVTAGNTNARAYGNVSTAGYVTTANNKASSYSNKTIGASVTQPATYYVNKGTLVAENISGASFLEETGDYGFRATVVVPEGYHAGETVTKDFTTGIFPAPESKGTADKMLVGYSLYDEDGKLITGTMPNQGAQNSTITTQNGTYTIPAGYHDGNGIIKATLGAATINAPSGSKAQSTPTFSFDATNRKLTASVAATSGTAYANVTGAGYTGTGTKSGTFTMSASSNTYTMDAAVINTPSATKAQSTPTFSWDDTNRKLTASVAATSATVYANTNTAGYAPAETRSGTVTMSASSNTYTIAAAVINAPSGSKAQSTPGMTFNASNGVVTASVAATSGTAYANVTTAGYTGTATKSGTFSMTASSNTYNVGLATLDAPSGTGSADVAASVGAYDSTNGTYPITGSNDITGTAYRNVTAGYTAADTTSGSVTGTATASGSIAKAGVAMSIGQTIYRQPVLRYGAVATGTTNAAGGALTTTKPTSGPYVVINSAANTATANASATLTAGYTDGTTANTTYSSTGKTSGARAIADTYIPITVGSATTPESTVYAGSPSVTVNQNNGYVTVASKSGTGSITPTVSEGWVASGTAGTITATSNASGLQLNPKTGDGSNYQNNLTITPTASDQVVMNRNEFLVANHIIVKSASSGPKGALTASSVLSGANFTPTLTYNSTAGTYSYGGSNTVTGTAYANVSTVGYVDTSNNKSASNTKAIYATGTLARTNVSTTVTGSSRTPVIRLGTVPSGVTNAANGAATTTKPSSGVYVVVNSPANTATVTATISGATAGYSDGTNYIKTQGTASLGAAASAETYIPINAAANNTQTGAATVSGGTASVTLSNITTQTTATNYKIQYNTTGGSVTAKTVTATAGPGFVASGTVNATATVSAATGSSNNGIVYLKAATPTNNTQSGAATIGTSSANASTAITGMETTTTNTGFIVSASADATSGAITAKTVTATAGITDGYSNVAVSAVANATVSAVAAKTASNSNTQYIKAATINGFSASYKAQSTPTFSINTSTGIVTASVAATSQDIYRNVTTGYVGTASTTKLTFTMNASSNTYNAIAGLGTTSRTANTGGVGVTSAGLVTNASNGAVNASDKMTVGTTATNGYYQLTAVGNGNVSTGTGYITSGTTKSNDNTIKYYVAKGSVSDYSNKYKQQSTPTISFNASNGVVSAVSAATTQTVYRNVTAGYHPAANTTSMTFTLNASGTGTDNILATKPGTLSKTAASASAASSGLVTNISNGAVNTSDKITLATGANGTYRINVTGGAGANVTTAGWLTAGTNVSNSTTSYIYVAKSNGASISKSPYTNGTAQTATISAGYLPSAITMTWNGVAAATRSAGTAAVLNNSNGNVRYYVNTTAGYTAANTTAYYLQLNTKAGGTTYVDGTGATLVNAGQFVTSAVIAKAANVTYNSNTQLLTIPAGLVTVS